MGPCMSPGAERALCGVNEESIESFIIPGAVTVFCGVREEFDEYASLLIGSKLLGLDSSSDWEPTLGKCELRDVFEPEFAVTSRSFSD